MRQTASRQGRTHPGLREPVWMCSRKPLKDTGNPPSVQQLSKEWNAGLCPMSALFPVATSLSKQMQKKLFPQTQTSTVQWQAYRFKYLLASVTTSQSSRSGKLGVAEFVYNPSIKEEGWMWYCSPVIPGRGGRVPSYKAHLGCIMRQCLNKQIGETAQ